MQVDLAVLDDADAVLFVPRVEVDSARLQEVLLHRHCNRRNSVLRAVLQVEHISQNCL